MSYLLKTSFHQDEFQKHIKVLFTSKPSLQDGNCGYHSILNSLKSSERCKTTYNCYSLRKDMFDKLSSIEFISILKNSLVHLYDLDEDKLSQAVSFTTQLENIRSNIYNITCTPSKTYYSKVLWFDMTNCLTILSIMYPTLSFYCYSELNNDVHIYKLKEADNKTNIERTNI